ncbi:MAG TPA: hypothetical protein VHM19_08165, partial [Polyangiales bacterium]|nr:hypothetical protein [Polyangiales bacterium]
LREEDVDKQEREQLAKAIADTRARTYPDQYADDAHWNAELGWLLVRNGQLEDGFALLERAPLAPARMGTKLFPNADSDDKYRELYLAALERLSHKLDATHIALAHIFTHHVAKKVQLDPVLLAEVERLSATKDGTVYLDAVAHLRYHEKSYDAARDAYEKLISVIEKRKLKFSDKEQLSHLYYDAGCMASLTGQLDLAKRRATKALQLWPLMYGNMAMDPDFNALRDSMGSAAFEQAFRPKDATAKPAH